MPNVSLIIVNWNGKDLVVDCLDALKEQTYSDVEIIVVDNGSDDGSVAILQKRNDIKLICLQKNKGFAGGNLEGLKVATGKHVALLNNDTIPDKNWLRELVIAMDARCYDGKLELAEESRSPGTIAMGSTLVYLFGCVWLAWITATMKIF